jgi:hypothetical protein
MLAFGPIENQIVVGFAADGKLTEGRGRLVATAFFAAHFLTTSFVAATAVPATFPALLDGTLLAAAWADAVISAPLFTARWTALMSTTVASFAATAFAASTVAAAPATVVTTIAALAETG